MNHLVSWVCVVENLRFYDKNLYFTAKTTTTSTKIVDHHHSKLPLIAPAPPDPQVNPFPPQPTRNQTLTIHGDSGQEVKAVFKLPD